MLPFEIFFPIDYKRIVFVYQHIILLNGETVYICVDGNIIASN